KALWEATVKGQDAAVWSLVASVAFSADGNELAWRDYLCVGTESRDAKTGKVLRFFAGPENSFRGPDLTGQISLNLQGLAFSPDGKLVIAADEDGGYGLWDLKTGQSYPKSLEKPRSLHRLTFSPDSQRIAW